MQCTVYGVPVFGHASTSDIDILMNWRLQNITIHNNALFYAVDMQQSSLNHL